jgi:hypothetical protein
MMSRSKWRYAAQPGVGKTTQTQNPLVVAMRHQIENTDDFNASADCSRARMPSAICATCRQKRRKAPVHGGLVRCVVKGFG